MRKMSYLLRLIFNKRAYKKAWYYVKRGEIGLLFKRALFYLTGKGQRDEACENTAPAADSFDKLSYFSSICAEKEVTCYFDHDMGGGANQYLTNIIARNPDTVYLVVRYNVALLKYRTYLHYDNMSFYAVFPDLDKLEEFLVNKNIARIVVNNLVSYPDVPGMLSYILRIKNTKNAKLDMLTHDFHAICPVFYLLDDKDEFCGKSKYSRCEACYPKNKKRLSVLTVNTNIPYWRSKWREFLRECDSITAFSNDSKNILESVFDGIPLVEVVPHTVDYIKPVNKKVKTTETLNIGILGNISFIKGLGIIKDMVNIIKKNALAHIRLIVVGRADEGYESPHLLQTGPYSMTELPEITALHDIDIFLIPSVWPETFSYTTQEAMEMDMPVACFDIGAPAERVREYGKGVIIPEMTAECVLDTLERWYSKSQLQESVLR